jgi:hypothetical protein
MDDARLLWIKGDPGKGKTMMTMGLIDELSPRDRFSNAMPETPADINVTSQPCLLAYFFCQSTRPNLNNVASVLRGLIYILVMKRENLVRHVQKPYDTEGGQLFERVSALVGILSDILNDASLPMTYLLVDALDECVSGLPELLNIITDDRLSKPSRTKWLVTSRNLPDIERYLHQDPVGVKISLELSASHVSKAVTSFIDVKVQALVSMKNYDRETQANVQQLLLDRAEGTFLWVWLVCKRMESVPRYRTMSMLRELPPGLDPLYDRMKQQILEYNDEETVEYCKHILQLIMLAYRPLRLEELVVIASLPTTQLADVEDLIGHCGSFLTIREGTVIFVHLSAKEYFTTGNGSQIFTRMLRDEQKQGWITHCFLEAMNSRLCRDMCNLRKPGARIQEATDQIKASILPRTTYACEYWIDHLCACTHDYDDTLLDNGKAHCFLQKHLLHWLEAMSLLRKIPHAIAAIQKLQSVLTVRS